MIFVYGQCFEIRLAILDGVVADAIPTAPSEPIPSQTSLEPPQAQSPEQSVLSSSGESSFTKVSAVRVSDESEAGSEYSVLFAE